MTKTLDLLDRLAITLGDALVAATEGAASYGLTRCRIGQRPDSTRVAPRLCIAVGVRGETSGFLDSEVIVAIDEDPRAEVFAVADYGIVGKPDEIIPLLIEALRKLRSVP